MKRFGAPSILKSKRKAGKEKETDSLEPPKKRGRLVGSKNKGKSEAAAPPKKRGRPKGSRNKNLTNQVNNNASNINDSMERLHRAADAATPADVSLDEETNGPESCVLCFFRFDDPIKKDKEITNCASCGLKVHKPCLQKNSCPCQSPS